MNQQQLGNVQTHILVQKLSKRLYFTQKKKHLNQSWLFELKV
jgi:hypothetical protein